MGREREHMPLTGRPHVAYLAVAADNDLRQEAAMSWEEDGGSTCKLIFLLFV